LPAFISGSSLAIQALGLGQFVCRGSGPDDLGDGDIVGPPNGLDHVVSREASRGFSPSVAGSAQRSNQELPGRFPRGLKII
jgi:hypothetical protein